MPPLYGDEGYAVCYICSYLSDYTSISEYMQITQEKQYTCWVLSDVQLMTEDLDDSRHFKAQGGAVKSGYPRLDTYTKQHGTLQQSRHKSPYV